MIECLVKGKSLNKIWWRLGELRAATKRAKKAALGSNAKSNQGILKFFKRVAL